jgi:hypothetical protein
LGELAKFPPAGRQLVWALRGGLAACGASARGKAGELAQLAQLAPAPLGVGGGGKLANSPNSPNSPQPPSEAVTRMPSKLDSATRVWTVQPEPARVDWCDS